LPHSGQGAKNCITAKPPIQELLPVSGIADAMVLSLAKGARFAEKPLFVSRSGFGADAAYQVGVQLIKGLPVVETAAQRPANSAPTHDVKDRVVKGAMP
jgi:hypothetical protein